MVADQTQNASVTGYELTQHVVIGRNQLAAERGRFFVLMLQLQKSTGFELQVGKRLAELLWQARADEKTVPTIPNVDLEFVEKILRSISRSKKSGARATAVGASTSAGRPIWTTRPPSSLTTLAATRATSSTEWLT